MGWVCFVPEPAGSGSWLVYGLGSGRITLCKEKVNAGSQTGDGSNREQPDNGGGKHATATCLDHFAGVMSSAIDQELNGDTPWCSLLLCLSLVF